MKIRLILVIIIGLIVCVSPSYATSEAQTAFQEGYVLLGGGDYYKAIDKFKIVASDPSYPLLDYAYFYIAEAYLRSHNPDEAKQVYTMVLNYFKDSVFLSQAWMGLAQAQVAAREKSAACNTLYEMISRFPNEDNIPEARYLLGNCLEDLGRYTEAARVYRNINILHSSSDYADKALERLDTLGNKAALSGYEAPAATLYSLGIKHFQSGNYKKAKSYFTRLVKNYGKSSLLDEADLMLGRICLRQSQFQAAEKYFDKIIAQNGSTAPSAMFYLSLAYAYQGSPRAAIAELTELVANFPKSSLADGALYYLGQDYKALGEIDSAIAAWEKLVAGYPNSEYLADTIWLIGNACYKQTKWQEAYNNFSYAFNLSPDKASDRLIFWAGKCAEKLNQRDRAVAAYKMTINRYDHSYYAYRAREELRKFGVVLEARAIPAVPELASQIEGMSGDSFSHEQKYNELIALGLGDEAAVEASSLAEKAPSNKQDKIAIAKYQAYVMKGKFIKPISFADRKIEEKMLTGTLTKLDPQLWRFAYPRGYWNYVEKYAQDEELDPALVYAVIREESRFKSQALSSASARGLMQIIPSTGRMLMKGMGMNYSRKKLYTPEVNIQLGSHYLAELIKRFDGNVSLALAGYNGGPVRVERWLKNYAQLDIDEFVEDIPLSETRNYVKKVMKSYYGYKRTYSNG